MKVMEFETRLCGCILKRKNDSIHPESMVIGEVEIQFVHPGHKGFGKTK